MMIDFASHVVWLTKQKHRAVYYPVAASENGHSEVLLSALTSHSAVLELNWQQLFCLVDQIADRLAQEGISCGDGVGLIGKNSLSQLLYYLAALSLGARVLLLNPQFPPVKLARLLQQYQIDFVFQSPLKSVIVPPELRVLTDQTLALVAVYQRSAPICWQQGLTLTLTSGSSGEAKAVVHDLTAHWQNARGVCEFLGFDQHKSWLLSLPLYHVSGQGIIWRWLSSGADLHFSGNDFYASIDQATHVSLVPIQLQRYLAYIQKQSAVERNTEAILLGGAHIEVELCRKAQQFGLNTFSGYGLTEMASTVFVRKNHGSHAEMRLLSGRELCICHGEIWLRGAGLAQGYWYDGKIIPLINAEGWYQTKDRGIWQNGELQVLGRIDNMFISGGENIQPEEIEAILQGFPQIEQVVVLPLDDQEFGARPVSLVRFNQPFSNRLVDQVRCWLQDKLERFKQPIAYYPLTVNKTLAGIKWDRKGLQQALQQQVNKISSRNKES